VVTSGAGRRSANTDELLFSPESASPALQVGLARSRGGPLADQLKTGFADLRQQATTIDDQWIARDQLTTIAVAGPM
jgi:hypothetical protein